MQTTKFAEMQETLTNGNYSVFVGWIDTLSKLQLVEFLCWSFDKNAMEGAENLILIKRYLESK